MPDDKDIREILIQYYDGTTEFIQAWERRKIKVVVEYE